MSGRVGGTNKGVLRKRNEMEDKEIMKKGREEEMNKSGEYKERLQRERKIKIKRDIKRSGRKEQTNKNGKNQERREMEGRM